MQQPQTIVEVVQPHWYEGVTIAAIVLGPVLALLVQRVLDWMRRRDETRRQLYFRLMSTRANFLSVEHVQAFNSVDIVFADDAHIRDLWQKCLDHVATPSTASGWTDKLNDLRTDLYQAIGNKLGYEYTTDYIKRGIYFPQLHDTVLQNQSKVLEGFAKAVDGGKLKIEVTSSAAPAPAPPVR